LSNDVCILDRICGIYSYSTSPEIYVDAFFNSIDDFVVEEIDKYGDIISLDNPTIKDSGYPGLFTHFVLIKRNIDTFTAIRIISNKLGIPRKWVFLSGLKDREAVTVQRGCVFGVDPDEINKIKWSPKLYLKSPIRELRRLGIGQHLGNRFTIRLSCNQSLEIILDEIQRRPILNFFGYQRFGIWKPISHISGKLLIQGKYFDSLLIFLLESTPFFPNRKLFLEYVNNNQYKEALGLLPRKGFYYERIILRNIARGYAGEKIIARIPRDFLRIIVESYQSFVFNLLLSSIHQENESIPEKLPLIGYSTDPSRLDSEIRNTLSEILSSENITYTNFRKKFLPKYVARGGWRASNIHIDKLEYNQNTRHTIRFYLPKGCFATIILREIVKSNILRLLLSRKIGLYRVNVYERMVSFYSDIYARYFDDRNLKSFA